MIIKIVLLSIICIGYLIYTVPYLIHFSRSNYFTGWLKAAHLLLICIIPFVWIILLKSLFKLTPGSHEFPDKKGPESMNESGLGIWMDQ